MADQVYDLAIIGAGCAGLSLAARLAEKAAHMKVVLIDPRTRFDDDRTWCFWTWGNTPVEALIDTRWPSWRFSDTNGVSIAHQNNHAHYACVRAARFYEAALKSIHLAGFELRMGEAASEVKPQISHMRIMTDKDPVLARLVLDTRPPQGLNATLLQVFSGVEIESRTDCFEPCQAGLMEDMESDSEGFRFTYILPFTARRALIELTRFTPSYMHPGKLDHGLEEILARRGLAHARVLRREHGILPMGQSSVTPPADPRILRAGSAAGALRAATGYAFLRIQHWAEACASSIAQGGPPIAHSAEPRIRAWMDSVFLTTIRSQPQNAPDYFLRIAKTLTPEAFARFMSDAALTSDLLRLMAALPPMPFLAAAARLGLHRSAAP